MVDRDDALQALGVICNATVTSVHGQTRNTGFWTSVTGAAVGPSYSDYAGAGSAGGTLLSISNFVPTVLFGDSIRIAAGPYTFQGQAQRLKLKQDLNQNTSGQLFVDERKLFAPEFNYDFTKLKDTETYHRGGEVYERPCGWNRLALKVLDEYDENAWLGTRYRSAQSVPGEWPVSYHGTSPEGADGIIQGCYQVGNRDLFGRGIYSTPFISVADQYAKTFTSDKTGKTFKVILQNRINPQHRVKKNNDQYWLVEIPKGTSNEADMVQRAIRPYGLLLKEV